jgi:hypothetical protein
MGKTFSKMASRGGFVAAALEVNGALNFPGAVERRAEGLERKGIRDPAQ